MTASAFQFWVFACFAISDVLVFVYFWLVSRDIGRAGKHTDDHLSNIDARLCELRRRLDWLEADDLDDLIRTERTREEAGD